MRDELRKTRAGDELATRVLAHVRRRNKRADLVSKLAIRFSVALCLLSAVSILSERFYHPLASVVLPALCLAFSANMVASAAKTLQVLPSGASHDDPCFLQILLLELDSDKPNRVDKARQSLTEVFPWVTPEKYRALSDGERAAFVRSLRSFDNLWYLRVAVETARRVGSIEVLEPLEAISRHTPSHCDQDEMDRVLVASRLALAEVRMRLAREVIHGTGPSHVTTIDGV